MEFYIIEFGENLKTTSLDRYFISGLETLEQVLMLIHLPRKRKTASEGRKNITYPEKVKIKRYDLDALFCPFFPIIYVSSMTISSVVLCCMFGQLISCLYFL